MSEPKLLTADEIADIIKDMQNGMPVRRCALPLANHIAALEARIAELMEGQANFPNLDAMRRCMFDTADENDTLKARIAALEPLAELGRLVEQMPEGGQITRMKEQPTPTYSIRTPGYSSDSPGSVRTIALYRTAADALRALVGEKDA